MKALSRLTAALLLVICLACAGCTIEQQFVKTIDATWDVICPEYVEYVKNDPNLDDASKDTRLRTAELMGKLITEAME